MQIYQEEVDWKMFVPPLPVHQVNIYGNFKLKYLGLSQDNGISKMKET
jgi:hypothetical protein